jgi:hypothetical protein
MKKSLTFLALTIAYSMNAQVQYQNTSTTGSSTSSAIGTYTVASAGGAFASGRDTKATGNYSTAMGYFSEANGATSTAMGSRGKANGAFSTVMGYD